MSHLIFYCFSHVVILLSFHLVFDLCRYTAKKDTTSSSGYAVYAIVLFWPEDNILSLGVPITTPATSVSMLGFGSERLK